MDSFPHGYKRCAKTSKAGKRLPEKLNVEGRILDPFAAPEAQKDKRKDPENDVE